MNQHQIADGLLFNATESQLRNVLALALRESISDAELIAFFEREEKMVAREAAMFHEFVPSLPANVVFINQPRA
jgi:hypothetical protein